MRKILNLVCGSAIALALAAPAHADEYANIHTVGIISAIGDSLSLNDMGMTVFQNHREMMPISDWGIDALVTQQVAAALAPRFAVKNVTVDPSPIETLKPGMLDAGVPDVRKFVAALPASNDVDAYVVVTKVYARDQISNTNRPLWGLGIYRHDLMFGSGFNYVYAYYGIVVINAKTGAQIDSGLAHLSDGFLWLNQLPSQAVLDADWADTPDTFPAAQKQDVKANLTAAVRTSLGFALKNAHLTGAP